MELALITAALCALYVYFTYENFKGVKKETPPHVGPEASLALALFFEDVREMVERSRPYGWYGKRARAGSIAEARKL